MRANIAGPISSSSWKAKTKSGSRRLERDVQEFAGRFLMFQSFRQHSQGEGWDFGDGLGLIGR